MTDSAIVNCVNARLPTSPVHTCAISETGFLERAKCGQIVLNRSVLTTTDVVGIDIADIAIPPRAGASACFDRIREKCAQSCEPRNCLRGWGRLLRAAFPCFDTARQYRWRTDLLSDLSAGLTVGVMNVPQGMAYSMLAGLPPVYGLYVSFIAPLLYALLGRCPQLSLGTFAVVSLLLSEPIRRLCDEAVKDGGTNMTYGNFTPVCFAPDIPDKTIDDGAVGLGEAALIDFRPIVAISLTFLIGIVQVTIGACRLGSLTCYMAPAMVDGFVTGAAFHVLTSQMSSLFGIKKAKKGDGIGSLFMVYVNLCRYIRETNLITLGISSVSVLFLLFIKMLIEPALAKYAKCHFPLPSELILVIMGTITAHYLDLQPDHNVTTVGHIAGGMPQLSVPFWSLLVKMIADALIIGFTSAFLTISLVKMFSLKYQMNINYNHELTAQGVITLCSSFASAFVPSGSVSRSMVCDGAGVKSPLNGLASSILVAFVLLFLGPYFSSTPTCVLAAIIAVALKNVLKRLGAMPAMWRTYKRDFFLFTITFLVTLLLDVMIGLIVGIVCCLVALTERQRKFQITPLDIVPGTELFVHNRKKLNRSDSTTSRSISPKTPILAFRLSGSLNFASSEQLSSRIHQLLGNQNQIPRKPTVDGTPTEDILARNEEALLEGVSSTAVENEKGTNLNDSPSSFYVRRFRQSLNKTEPYLIGVPEVSNYQTHAYLLLDLSSTTHMDPSGAAALRDIHNALYSMHMTIVYTGDIQRHKCLDTSGWPHPENLSLSYASLVDAFVACYQDREQLSTCADVRDPDQVNNVTLM